VALAAPPAEQGRGAEERDAALGRALAERRQVIALPNWVRELWIDPKGEPWFQGEVLNGNAIDEVRASLASAVAGKTRVIRGGRPIFRDGRGRFWVLAVPGGSALVLGHDGKQWYERKAAQTQSKEVYDWGWMQPLAVEDAAGNVFFLGQDKERGWGMHRLAPDGQWSYQNLVPAADAYKDEYRFLDDSLSMYTVKQPGGRITLCSRRGPPGGDAVRVLHYDGSTWALINPLVCKRNHDVTAVVPFTDGSIGTICEAGGLWTYWPASTPVDEKAVAALVKRLDADDPEQRDRAGNELVAIGPKLRQRLEKVLAEEEPAPEAALRIKGILASFAAADTHGHGVLYGGRYTFGQAYLASRSRDGRTVLYVEEVVDVPNQLQCEKALAIVRPGGTWEVREIPVEQWHKAGWKKLPTNCYEDRKGRVYLEGGLRTNAANELEPVTNLGVALEEIVGEDAAGRLFVRSRGRYFILDETAPAPKPDLPVAKYTVQRLRGFNQDGSLVGTYVDDSPIPLWRFRAGRWEPIPDAKAAGGVYSCIPLSGGGAVVEIGEWANQKSAFVFDGRTVQQRGASLWQAVRENPDPFRKLAGHSFAAIDRKRLGADDRGHLWFGEVQWEAVPGQPEGQRQVNRLMYNDGKDWRDVWAETAIQPPNVDTAVALVDRGRTLLLRDATDKALIRVWFDGQAMRAAPVETPAKFPTNFRASQAQVIVSSDRANAWVGVQFGAFAYGDGRLRDWPNKGQPIYADGSGRLWSLAGEVVRVQDASGKLLGELAVDGFTSDSRVLETRDGRTLLVHSQGISEVVLDAAGATGSLKESRRWSWGTVRNQLDYVFCDAENGVWVVAGPKLVERYALPAKLK
jgi:hypothetical protein